mgnify:CR=1 FL=1
MADTVTGPTILIENDKRVVIKIVNQSDGTGATTVFGDGGDSYARLDEEDDDGDIPIIGLTGTGHWDFRDFGGIPADKSNNTNESDVNLVVPGAADSGNMYTIVAEFQKIY